MLCQVCSSQPMFFLYKLDKKYKSKRLFFKFYVSPFLLNSNVHRLFFKFQLSAFFIIHITNLYLFLYNIKYHCWFMDTQNNHINEFLKIFFYPPYNPPTLTDSSSSQIEDKRNQLLISLLYTIKISQLNLTSKSHNKINDQILLYYTFFFLSLPDSFLVSPTCQFVTLVFHPLLFVSSCSL